jgi:hypothetical protein
MSIADTLCLLRGTKQTAQYIPLRQASSIKAQLLPKFPTLLLTYSATTSAAVSIHSNTASATYSLLSAPHDHKT